MTETVQQWSGSVHSTTGQIGVVWVSHGNKLIRCHPAQVRRCSEREVSIASLKGLVQVSMPTSVTELTNALSPGQYEDLSTSLPTRDDLRFGEVDLEAPPVDQETIALSVVLLFHSGTVVTQLQNTSARLSSIPNPVSASSVRESDVQTGESSLTPGSIQISPRELTRCQGELVRSSLENADRVNGRRRIVGKRTITSPAPLALLDNVDSASVPESSQRLVCERFSSLLKVTRRNVGWNLLMNRWIGSREKGHQKHGRRTFLMNEKHLRLTLVILWNLKGLSVEIHRCGCQRDCQVRGYLSPPPARSTVAIRLSNDKRLVTGFGC